MITLANYAPNTTTKKSAERFFASALGVQGAIPEKTFKDRAVLDIYTTTEKQWFAGAPTGAYAAANREPFHLARDKSLTNNQAVCVHAVTMRVYLQQYIDDSGVLTEAALRVLSSGQTVVRGNGDERHGYLDNSQILQTSCAVDSALQPGVRFDGAGGVALSQPIVIAPGSDVPEIITRWDPQELAASLEVIVEMCLESFVFEASAKDKARAC